jgi:hypothetical protein
MPLTEQGLDIGTTILLGANLRNEPPLENPERARIYKSVWISCFADCDDATFVKACHDWLRMPGDKGQWWPVPAQLRAIIPHLAIEARDMAEDAWLHLLKAAERASIHDAMPDFDSRTSDALRAIGGWHRMLQITYDEISFARRDFLAAYRAAAEREDQFQALTSAESTKFLADLKGMMK